MRRTTAKIFICNMSEDIWPFISSLEDTAVREFEINENANMSDLNIFSFGPKDMGVFVTPRRLSRDFLSYAQGLTGTKNVTVLSPRRHSGETCRDVLLDRNVFAQLVSLGKKFTLSLAAYSPSRQFYALVEALRRRGVMIVLKDVPEPQDRWAAEFFGSKIGIRQLATGMSIGYACWGPADAVHIADHIYEKTGSVVIKTNKGHSGFGVLIFRPGELPRDRERRIRILRRTFARNSYWTKFPIVVEEYKKENPAIAGGFPSVECHVEKDGSVQFLYYCGMRMTHEGVFRGLEIHKSIVSPTIDRKVREMGVTLGKQLASFGYRGFFDVDMLAGKDGRLYVTESNVRRTGGTYVYHLAVCLFGKKFMETTFTLSRNSYPIPQGRYGSFAQLRDRLAPVLYDKKAKEGLILTSENLLTQDATGYIIFAGTKKRALAIEERMEELIQ